MKTDGRGGRRDRAGRKRFFDEFRRLSIGGDAEKRLEREWQNKVTARVLAAHAGLNLQATYAAINDPKQKGLRSTYPASLEDDEAPDDHQTFAEQIQDAQNKVAQRKRKHVIPTGSRVYGVRSSLAGVLKTSGLPIELGGDWGFAFVKFGLDSYRPADPHEQGDPAIIAAIPLVGVLLNPKFPPAMRQLMELEDAARNIGQKLFVSNASNDSELAAAFDALLQQKIGALLVAADPYFATRRERLIAFASQHRLAAFYQFREYAVAGGLISYGPSVPDEYRLAGNYVGRILKGAKPAELPIVQPTKFELVINQKTAKALGLNVPPSILTRADEVIE